MNEVIMTGYVATEPEINEFKRKRRKKKTPQYGLAANFRLSVKRPYKRKDGKKYDYFSCSAYDKSAEYIEEYIDEGDFIGIHGTILNDNYENDEGDMVYRDKITIVRIELLRKGEEDDEDYEDEEDDGYDDEYEDDDYDDEEEGDYEDEEDEDYEDEEDEDYEDEEEEGYHRSLKKPKKNGTTKTSRKRNSVRKKSTPARRTQQKSRRPSNSRKTQPEKKKVVAKKSGTGKKRNLIDEEFERVQESEYDNNGFD